VIREQINISFALDGGSSSAFVYSSDTRCYSNDGPSGCYNTSVYNTQSLTYSTHSLNVTMFTYQDQNVPPGYIEYSDLFFDYAVISTTISSSVNPSSTGNVGPSSRSTRHTPVAAIGGAVGGIAAIVAIVLATLLSTKKSSTAAISRGSGPRTYNIIITTNYICHEPLSPGRCIARLVAVQSCTLRI